MVFRRAAELDQRGLTADGRVLDIAALEQAGAEAGLSREAIRQALAEVRAGTAALPEQRPHATAARTVTGRADAVQSEVGRFMRHQGFRVIRDMGDRAVWAPDRSLAATVRRVSDINRRMVLRQVTRVTTVVVGIPGDNRRTHVRFELDLGHVRAGWYTMPAVLGGLSVAAVATLAALGIEPAAVLAAPGAAAVAGGAYAGARAGYRGSLRRSTTAVELFLDRMEHGR